MIEYDDFQQKAIALVDQDCSILVSAPTGSGKTLIAEYVIQKVFTAAGRIIYTSPIKALSNQKYRDFRALYGPESVGIITGDVSINPDAPVMIMTTEIYRNGLLEHERRWRDISWIIFDECHYLDDPERGTVWEEAMMFSPQNVKFLCLSATVPNIRQLAAWMRMIHNRSIEIVIENNRPVPLVHRYQCNGKIFISPQILKKEIDTCRSLGRKQRKLVIKPNRVHQLIKFLLENDGLPAIYFSFGRQRSEYLAHELHAFDFLTPEEKKQVQQLFRELCAQYSIEKEHSLHDLESLISRGIAYHHAGMLPPVKEIVERLFTSRLIKLIFTTETFALGINMPARSVVFDELRKFYGMRFDRLKTRDYYQMAGRAGRRGMDERGFVYSRINPHMMSYKDVHAVIFGATEHVSSQFNTGYATILNLYTHYGDDIVSLYTRSFHHFQASRTQRPSGYEPIQRKLNLLKQLQYIDGTALTPKGQFAALMYGYELLLGEMHESGFLDTVNCVELSILLSALVFEPRKGWHVPDLTDSAFTLRRKTEAIVRGIHREERHCMIDPYSKWPHFHLAREIDMWCQGSSFQDVMEITTVDEGELVRCFRMVIQLLRQIRDACGVSDTLKQQTGYAIHLINRDVIDAQKQLMQ